ncbi:hypothetical protein [Paracoccus sp. SSK6]|uniref:hypothetical protein n=1 Tax=Paracoccus sp. SSK6 TaxID=3143131 RepID=UPI003219933A
MANNPLVVAFLSDVSGAIRGAREYAESILGIRRAARNANEEVDQSGQTAADAATRGRNAMRSLGVMSEQVADRQIARLREQFEQVRQSGVATPEEIARAHEAMEQRISRINDTIGRNTRGTFDRMGEHARRVMGGIGGKGMALAGGAAAAGAGALSVGALAGGIKTQADRARELETATEAAGLDPKNASDLMRLQRFAFATQAKYGTDISDLGDTLKDVNDKIGELEESGGGELLDLAEMLGPLIGISKENFKASTDGLTDRQLKRVAKSQGITKEELVTKAEEDAKKAWATAVAREFKGKDSLETFEKIDAILDRVGASIEMRTFAFEALANNSTIKANLFDNDGAELKRLGDMGEKTGAFLSPEDLAKFQTLNEQLATMGLTAQSLSLALADAGILEAFDEFMQRLTGIIEYLKESAPWLLEIIKGFSLMTLILVPLAAIFAVFAIAAAAISSPILAIIALFVTLGAGIVAFWGKIKSVLPKWIVGDSGSAPEAPSAAVNAAMANAQTGPTGTPINLNLDTGTYQTVANPDVAAAIVKDQTIAGNLSKVGTPRTFK